MSKPIAQLNLSFTETNADTARLDELTTDLTRELRAMGADSVSRPIGEISSSLSRSDEVTVGTLLLVLTPVVLNQLIEYMKVIWLNRRRRAEIEFETPSGTKVRLELTPETDWSKVDSALKKAEKHFSGSASKQS